jgi:hypothetical protein
MNSETLILEFSQENYEVGKTVFMSSVLVSHSLLEGDIL